MPDALQSLALPCLGEFLAALQIQYALLGKGRLPLWASVAGSLALWAVTQGLWGHYTAFSFWALFFNALRMLMASMFFGGTLTKKAFSVVACGGITLFYGNLLGSLVARFRQIRLAQVWLTPEIMVLYLLLNLFVYLGIRVLKKQSWVEEPVQRRLSGLYLTVLTLLSVILTAFGQMSLQYEFLFLICLGLVISVMIYFALLAIFNARLAQANQTVLQMKMEQERADALMESYQAQRRLTHEFTNHMDAVNFYLNKGDAAGAREYLASVAQRISAGTSVVNTHNPLLDALLSRAYHSASEKEIMMNFDLCDLRQFPLSNTDMVTVISNLLDNAIRAAAQADPPQINVRIKQMDGEYVVSVRNRVREDVPLHGDELPASTKQEPGHGVGLANVRSVLVRYGGEYAISCKDRWFCFTFTVPVPAS